MENSVNCPRFNANDDTYFVQYFVESGTQVDKDSVLVELETSKAIVEVTAEEEGYFFHNLELDYEVSVGELLGVISQNADYTFNVKTISNENDIEIVKSEKVLTEKISPVRGVERIAVIGGGKGFDQIMDLVSHLPDKEISCVYDDDLYNEKLQYKKCGIPVIGKINSNSIVSDYYRNHFDAVVISISSNLAARNSIYHKIAEKVPFSILIHPLSYVSRSASIGRGTVIFQYSSISAYAKVGSNCFLSAYTNVEHHCELGNTITTGPAVFLSGSVVVGDRVKFGSSVTVEPNVKIVGDTIVGSTSLVNFNVETPSVITNNQSIEKKVNKWKKE